MFVELGELLKKAPRKRKDGFAYSYTSNSDDFLASVYGRKQKRAKKNGGLNRGNVEKKQGGKGEIENADI